VPEAEKWKKYFNPGKPQPPLRKNDAVHKIALKDG